MENLSKDLTEIMERNVVVSRYLGCICIRGVLSLIGDGQNSSISFMKYAAGSLYATQDSIDHSVLEKLKEGVWKGEENKYFKYGQKVNLFDEPIIVVHSSESTPRYVISGNTRARYKILKENNNDATITAIDVEHPCVERVTRSIEKVVGFFRIPELKI